MNADGQIVDIVNNYARMSFNFGPTLLSWMQRKKPEVYQQIIQSDRLSREMFSGHGSAIAQCYNHMIMPLANSRDQETQVIWGIRDFEYRFGRKPEGMWLPETAVDLASLEVLAAQGIRFTILAPRQAAMVRRIKEKDWHDVAGEKINPKRPYLCRLPSGASIVIFFYDGPIAKDVAFRNLLQDGERFSGRLMSVFSEGGAPQLVHIATDGESYGHHHRFGDMALAYCLEEVQKDKAVQLTVYAEFLEKFPPEDEVKIFENSSWSCVHGVERWRDNCGCNSGGRPRWTQKWRAPLRKALDWLRDRAAEVYQEKGAALLRDIRDARNAYIEVVLRQDEACRQRFLQEHASRDLTTEEKSLVLHLLEMQRNCMLMYTSCGWFFDDISGIETVQILQYAAKVLQLAHETTGRDFMPEFLEYLKTAPGNDKRYRNGEVVFKKLVMPAVVDMKRVVAHYAMTSLFEDYAEAVKVYCFSVRSLDYEVFKKEEERLAVGRVVVHSDLTCEEKIFSFVVFHFGGHDIYAGISEQLAEKDFVSVKKKMSKSFLGVRSRSALRVMRRNFEHGPFSLKHLFRDEQAGILYQMLDSSLVEVERSLREIHDHHYPIMRVIRELNMPLPKVLVNTVLVMVNTDFLNVLAQDAVDFKRLKDLVDEVLEWELDIDERTLEFFVSRRMKHLMDEFYRKPKDQKLLKTMTTILHILEPLKLRFDVGKVQNLFFSIAMMHYHSMKQKADKRAQKWVELFQELAKQLNVVINTEGRMAHG